VALALAAKGWVKAEQVFYFLKLHACLMEHLPLPRLVSGNCPACLSAEIVVKIIGPDGISYEGYCPGCGGISRALSSAKAIER
jgi:hypothetical protein